MLLQDGGGGGDWWDMIDREHRLANSGGGNGQYGYDPSTGTVNGGIVAPNPNARIEPIPPGSPTTAPQTGGTIAPPNIVIDKLKSIIGSDYSPENIKRHLAEIQALGIEVQNQERGDLRPRFRLANGDQWDFGPGGWINSAKNVGPGFREQGTPGSNPLNGSNGGILDTLRNTPGYQFTLEQGLRGVQSSAFAKGTGLTGGTLKAIMQYGSGLADSTYDAATKRYRDASQLGKDAVNDGST